MGKIKITKEEIIRLYTKEKKTLKQISKIAECHLSNIYGHLNRAGIKRRTLSEAGKKYNLNENYFNKVDSEEKAYILGFLYADGYNQVSKNQIRLTLNKKDVDILDKINKCLNYDRPLLLLRNNYLDLSINSIIMSKQLEKLGCMQNKTFNIVFPKFIPEDLIRHFIRGYFDGDGCLSITNRKDRPSKSYQVNLLGRLEFISKVQEILIQKTNINKTKLVKTKNVFYMSYTGKQNFIKITDYLYKNSNIYLDRKYNLYLSTLTQ